MPASSELSAKGPTFEQQLASLEKMVAELEEGRIGLAEALARYEEAVSLLRGCYQSLEQAQRKIEILSGVNPEGEAVTTPWDDAPPNAEEKPGGSRARRGSRAKSSSLDDTPPPEIDAPRGLF